MRAFRTWLARALDTARIATARGQRYKRKFDATRLGRTLQRYSEENGGVLSGGIAYSSLTSIAAALVLAVTIASFVVARNDEFREAIIAFVSGFIPGIFPEDGSPGLINPDSLKPTAITGIVGLIAFLFLLKTATNYLSNLRVGVRTMLGGARLGGLVGRAWDALALVALFVVILLGTAIQVVGVNFANALAEAVGEAGTSPWAVRMPSLVAGFIADAGFVALVYVVLGRARGPRRMLVAVIGVAALGIMTLQQLSALFVGSASDNPVLAPFAAVLAVLLFVTFTAQILLYGAAWLGAGIPDRSMPAPVMLPAYSRRKRGTVTTSRAVGR